MSAQSEADRLVAIISGEHPATGLTAETNQIRRAHSAARPGPANPAWQNCHRDCGVLLTYIEQLEQAIVAQQREQP